MALWLLKKDQSLFEYNYGQFVSNIGYYKDCLNLAQMALDRNYSDEYIRILLTPMAVSLLCDENLITQSILNKSKTPQLSLASKWAPREGKSFSNLIPYLKDLCNITGPQSNMKWRKFIQHIVKYSNKVEGMSIETLLSTKRYDLIDFDTIPSKALNLYKNTFLKIPGLRERYFEYIHDKKQKKKDIMFLNKNKLQMVKQFIPLVKIHSNSFKSSIL